MNSINTFPIESYLEKTRIASKNGSKTLVLDVKEAQILAECLSIVMTRLVSKISNEIPATPQDTANITVKMDGGNL